jgi:hypothetical protein
LHRSLLTNSYSIASRLARLAIFIWRMKGGDAEKLDKPRRRGPTQVDGSPDWRRDEATTVGPDLTYHSPAGWDNRGENLTRLKAELETDILTLETTAEIRTEAIENIRLPHPGAGASRKEGTRSQVELYHRRNA